MSNDLQSLLDEYAEALRSFMSGGGEAALEKAYDIGHRALSEGMGVVQLATIHHQALAMVFASMPDPRMMLEGIYVVENCFLECLAPFEMTHRGFAEANVALEASEKRFRELFENANDIVFTTDLKGRFTSINRAGEQFGGYPREEILELNIRDVVGPENHEMICQKLKRKMDGEPATLYELPVITKQGLRTTLEVCTRLIFENGNPVGVHGIARDISARKVAEEALFRLNERLEEEIKRIAHALHDEAGQLLASVHIALDEAARESLPSGRNRLGQVKELLDQIEDQLRRLSHELRPTILDDLGLVPALEFLGQGVSKRSGIPVNVEGSAVGRLASPIETTLYRVVQEALNNAVKHSTAHRIDVHLACQQGFVRCSINDDGIGFSLREAFDLKGRRGLGLIGMRERLWGVGGTFLVKAEPGHGTEVIAIVPLESSSAAANFTGR